MVPCQVLLQIIQLVFSTRYLPLRFTCSVTIGYWSSSCHNSVDIKTAYFYSDLDKKIYMK